MTNSWCWNPSKTGTQKASASNRLSWKQQQELQSHLHRHQVWVQSGEVFSKYYCTWQHQDSILWYSRVYKKINIAYSRALEFMVSLEFIFLVLFLLSGKTWRDIRNFLYHVWVCTGYSCNDSKVTLFIRRWFFQNFSIFCLFLFCLEEHFFFTWSAVTVFFFNLLLSS